MNFPVLWITIALLCLLAMAFVLVPLLRFRAGLSASVDSGLEERRNKNREVYQHRLLEIDRELQQGLVSIVEVERLKTELQRAFMRDMEALEVETGSVVVPARKFGWLPVAFILVLPVMSLLFYRHWGAGPDLVLPDLLQQIQVAEDAASQTALLHELAEVLQARFDRDSSDLQGAYMLATLYSELEQHEQALETFDRMLLQMQPGADMATVLGQIARTRYQLSEGQLTDEVRQAIDRAVTQNPNEYQAMGILANDAFNRDDLVTALGFWRRQLSSAPPGSRQAASLQQVIAMVESALPEASAAEPAVVDGPVINVVIDIDPALKDSLDGKQSLFVYVRNPDMRPPLVAQNLPIPEFPFSIALDNSMSMLPGMTLESAPTLLVGARLSVSGTAIAGTGDLQTVSAPFVLSELEGSLTLVIDEVVP
jgi:cytochrome c-type biogenesis protein CcmH